MNSEPMTELAFRWLAAASLAALLTTGQVACTPARSPRPAASAELHDVGEAAEALFDAAWASDWSAAEHEASSLRRAASGHDASVDSLVERIEVSISSRDRLGLLDLANDLTRVVVERTPETPGGAPRAISWLDVYGRTLRVSVEAARVDQQKAATGDIVRAWASVRDAVIARGGRKEATAVDDTVARIRAGAPAAEMASLATALLDQVDELEKVYSR